MLVFNEKMHRSYSTSRPPKESETAASKETYKSNYGAGIM